MTSPSTRAAGAVERWILDELVPGGSEEQLRAQLEALEALARDFESRRDRLAAAVSAPAVLAWVREYEALVATASRVQAYGSLRFAADTREPAALAAHNRIQQRLVELHNRTLFFSLWWQGLLDEVAEPVLAELLSAGAPDVVHYLEELRRVRPYRLDETSERLINQKDADGISAVLTLYSMVTSGFEFAPPDANPGDSRKVSRDGLMAHAHSPQPAVREAAFRELYRVYQEHAAVLAQMYIHRVRDWHNENVRLRGYKSPIAVRNVANDIPDAAVEILLEVVREGAPVFRRYFEKKARWLGMERLRRYDIYAPLEGADQQVDLGAGLELVFETFDEFHPTMGRLARQVVQHRHLDSELRPGKKGGAFCATVNPTLVPWVLVNYAGKNRDVATLAHELGHAVHSQLAGGHSVLTQQPSLPLAETASVFGEMLVTQRLLASGPSRAVQRELLASAIDDIFATVLRQAYFVRFEVEAHRAIVDGASPEDLDRLYRANLDEQFGSSVLVGEEFDREWLLIPHIYSAPFYCYAYSFGQLLVLALYQRFREQGEAFKPGYLKLLAYGGAARPQEVLAEAGVDIEDAEFWRGGLAFVARLLEQLEACDR